MSNATAQPVNAWRAMPATDRWRAFLAARATSTASLPWTRRCVEPCGWRAPRARASVARA